MNPRKREVLVKWLIDNAGSGLNVAIPEVDAALSEIRDRWDVQEWRAWAEFLEERCRTLAVEKSLIWKHAMDHPPKRKRGRPPLNALLRLPKPKRPAGRRADVERHRNLEHWAAVVETMHAERGGRRINVIRALIARDFPNENPRRAEKLAQQAQKMLSPFILRSRRREIGK